MGMRQETNLLQEQRLGLRLNPQQIQSIQLMELPLVDLQIKIAEELQKNPALIIKKDTNLVSLDRLNKGENEKLSRFEGSSDPGRVLYSGGKFKSDIHREFIEGALSRGETLQEHLLWQLHLENIPPEVSQAGELLIGNLSSDGFNIEKPETILGNFSKETVRAALDTVQHLDPPGCACADYKESLAAQARISYGAEIEEKIKMLFSHLSELERGHIMAISRKTGMREEELTTVVEKLKTLSPFPGRQFATGGDDVRFIIPDIRVIRTDGEFKIIINNEEIPVLGISPFFLKNVDTQFSSERNFIRDNLKEAKWFINSLNRRSHTLFRVSRAIVHYQKEFFLNGPKSLAPLTLGKIAEKLGLHETTVSRAANGKYMETDWGIFEIRYFFTTQVSSTSGGKSFSKNAVKEIVREIISNENKSLSDNQIVSILEEHGVKVARRTVNKYRNELAISTSNRR
jgi:RNA polymerase sigma-54 factor